MAQTLLEIAEAERRRRALEEFRASRPTAGQPAGGVSVDSQAASELGTGIRGAFSGLQEGLTFGGVDSGVGAISALLGGMPNEEGTSLDMFNYDAPMGERYAASRDFVRGQFDADQEAAPGPYAFGQFTGMAVPGAVAGTAVGPGAGMLGTMGRMATLGGVEGGLAGLGLSDSDTWGETASDATIGATIGAGLGMFAVPAVSAVQRMAADPIGGVVGAIRGVPNPARAGRALERAFQRSGQTMPDVQRQLYEAALDGQDVFRTADALGLPGQRMLAGVARSPGDGSREIVEWLNSRQMGQGERVSSFVADAVGTPETAAARELAQIADRRADASVGYGDARMQAGPVDVASALQVIDDRLGQINVPGVGQAVSPSPLDRQFEAFRARLSVPASSLPPGTTNMTLSDFSRVFEVKRELDGAISAANRAGDGFQVQMLTTLKNTLDDALADASTPYAGARDTYRQQSQVIDAIGAGREAVRPSVRTDDAMAAFNRLAPQQTPNPGNLPAGGMSVSNPENLPVPYQPPPTAAPNPQDGFRVGYVDPLLARIENMPPTTDAARNLTTPKTQEILAALASDPDLLARRIARERTMFDTRQMSVGGSPTANLLQDIADVGDTSPNLAQVAMNPVSSIVNALGTRAGAFVTGQNEQTRALIARALMSDDPQAALAPLLQAAMQSQTYNRGFESMLRGTGYQALLPTE